MNKEIFVPLNTFLVEKIESFCSTFVDADIKVNTYEDITNISNLDNKNQILILLDTSKIYLDEINKFQSKALDHENIFFCFTLPKVDIKINSRYQEMSSKCISNFINDIREIEIPINDDDLNNFIFENALERDKILEILSDEIFSLKQIKLLANFIFLDIRNKIKEFPRTSSESKVSDNSQQYFALLEKLDHIDQNLTRLRELPFFFRNHSISFKFANAILSKLKPIAKKFRLDFGQQEYIDTTINLNGDQIRPFENIFSILKSKKQELSEVVFKKHVKPDISIIVPVYGKLNALSRLISSLHKTRNDKKFEVIIVDDCGPQKVSGIIDTKKSNIKIIRNKKNQGFGNTCNIGAKEAKGKYLFFVNSDTVVADYSIDHVVNGFELASNVGIVGSQLLYDNFRRQESGGIIFSDGDAHNSGKNTNIDNSFHTYTKDCDYVSGAALSIMKKDFLDLGGFDEVFSPAYYEDTSLCMDMRHKLNKRVLINPLSIVFHTEGVTNGTSTNSGIKKYQKINKVKFVEKHKEDLKTYESSKENIWGARDRYTLGNILVIDQCIPTPKEDSGSKDMDVILKTLLNMNLRPHLFAISNRTKTADAFRYEEMGVHTIYGKDNRDFSSFYSKYANIFDAVIISRVVTANEVLNKIKSISPDKKTIFYTVDLHHKREYERYLISKKDKDLDISERTKQSELQTIEDTDITIVLTDKEKKYLKEEHLVENSKIKVIPLLRDIDDELGSFKKAKKPKDIIFIGGFRHHPNEDGIKWLSEEVLPIAKALFAKNDIKFPQIKVYGSNPTMYIKSLNSKYIKYCGFIDKESDAFKNASVSLAPLRYGSGQKGKVLSSIIFRTNIVGTNFAFEGFENLSSFFESGVDPNNFAKNILSAYKKSISDDEYKDQINYINQNYSMEKAKDEFSDILF